MSDLIERLASEFHLSSEERSALLPSGASRVFASRVGWARTYLGKAGLLETPARGAIRLTLRGKGLLEEAPVRVDSQVLLRYPEFVAFKERTPSIPVVPSNAGADAIVETPDEAMGRAHTQLQESLIDDVMSRIRGSSPKFFEKLVLDVLVAMGYGGSLQDAARVVGQSGDGGIDGVIKEDKLGLEMIYIQAKRWEGQVGRPQIQSFAGSLEGFRARKGVFITTSAFSRDARDYVERIDKRIVLIDGSMLARLMIEHDVGVTVIETFHVRRVDSDYFTEA